MKKYLFFLLALLPMALAFSACSDDNDLPDVDFDITFSGAQSVDGVLYVVQGQSFEVTGIKVTNREEGKGAGISAADYYWDYVYVGTSIQPLWLRIRGIRVDPSGPSSARHRMPCIRSRQDFGSGLLLVQRAGCGIGR